MTFLPKIHFPHNVATILIISTLFLGINHLYQVNGQVDVQVDCIIITFSQCSSCVEKYNSYVDPFYEEYKQNESISFSFIDASQDPDYFFEQMEKYNITISDYGNLPWVIFIWETNNTVVLDIETITADNGVIKSTFESILLDIGYIPPDNNGNSPPSFDVIDTSLLVYAVVLIGGIVFILTIGSVVVDRKTDLRIELKRIEKEHLFLISSFALSSLTALTYQLLDFLGGGCGCASKDQVKVLLFRKHEIFNFFNLEIPFALLGIIILSLILIQILLLGILPFPLTLSLGREKSFTLDENFGRNWYYFIIVQLSLMFVSLFYLLYLELFVIDFICTLCTFSQASIIIILLLVLTWRPFPKELRESSQ